MSKKYVLTKQQLDLLFEHERTEDKAKLNVGGYVEFKGDLKVDFLCKAHGIFTRENDVFRFNIVEYDSWPWQKCGGVASEKLKCVDFSKNKNAELDAYRFSEKFINEPYYLYGEPLLRAALVKVSSDLYLYVFGVTYFSMPWAAWFGLRLSRNYTPCWKMEKTLLLIFRQCMQMC